MGLGSEYFCRLQSYQDCSLTNIQTQIIYFFSNLLAPAYPLVWIYARSYLYLVESNKSTNPRNLRQIRGANIYAELYKHQHQQLFQSHIRIVSAL